MVEFDLKKITGREPPVETDEDMMNALADALGDADALRTERDALRARVAELQQHRDGHLPSCNGMDFEQMRCGCGYLDGTAYRELQARVAELEAWLRKDARHAPRCMMLDQYDERDFGCTCGLDALRAGPSAGAVPK